MLAAFIAQRHFAKHLRRMRELYGARLTVLRPDMERYLNGVLKLADIEAGLHAPAFLVNGMKSQEATDRATRRNLEVLPLSLFSVDRSDIHGLLLGFAAFNEREIRKGVTELARALD